MLLFAVKNGHLSRKPAGEGCWKQQGLAAQKVWLGQCRMPGEEMEEFSSAVPLFLAPAVCPLSLISGLHRHLAPRAAPRAVGGTGGAEPGLSKLL